ncbi:Cl-channel protein [Phanerochaete sordida]|uniref:Chloride channel protein n=1 Tax=Phanerochaete sordida TaxID=48140 RepID=A0A9P3LK74_9APHY|nr:Cl-channel protein [Phanerochaete sordida]
MSIWDSPRRHMDWLKSWSPRVPGAGPGAPSDSARSSFELLERGGLLRADAGGLDAAVPYAEGTTIDWHREEAAERERRRTLRAERGLRGVLAPVADSARTWLVIVLTGLGIGVAGAWLDVLVRWLGDLREGRCTYGFFYNQVACCSGLDPGEVCTEWKTWSEYLRVSSILGQSLLQAWIYIALAIMFAGSAAVLVVTYAPYAFHTGIPEIKAILRGYVFDAFLSPWTLLIKALGLALAVASGLSLGKEGPLVHVSCCLAFLLSRIFRLQHNESQKRKLLAAAAAAGVSVAFGSPLGGVLFGLEELDTFAFSNESDVLWRGFVTSVIAAVSLQYIDPFGTSKLVLFEVSGAVGDTWRAFELIPWMLLAIVGGVVGTLLIRLNAAAAVYRRNSAIHDWPVLEVVSFAALTGAVCYLVVFLRVQTSELVANLFQECDATKGDYHGLCNPTALWHNVFLLILTAAVKVLLTAWTFGMMVPAGIFLPTIAIGACFGRAVGLLTQGLQRAYPDAPIFSSCPPDASIRCISPGFYAVVGAAAMLGGVTRMTVSLVVIMFELTGALSHVLPIMISVVVSKWVADALGRDGIYTVWIAMRRYPWLPPGEHRDSGQTAAQIMTPAPDLVVLRDGAPRSVAELLAFARAHRFHGLPVVAGEDDMLVGFVVREKLRAYLERLTTEEPDGALNADRGWTFVRGAAAAGGGERVDLAPLLDPATLQLRKDVPLQLVVNMFQKMNLRHVLFSQEGRLTGLVTKTDIVWLLNAHSPHAGQLAGEKVH